MSLDNRKMFTYHGVTVVPQIGKSRYFGCRHGDYLTKWWRILFGPLSWVLTGSKEDARGYIDTHDYTDVRGKLRCLGDSTRTVRDTTTKV